MSFAQFRTHDPATAYTHLPLARQLYLADPDGEEIAADEHLTFHHVSPTDPGATPAGPRSAGRPVQTAPPTSPHTWGGGSHGPSSLHP